MNLRMLAFVVTSFVLLSLAPPLRPSLQAQTPQWRATWNFPAVPPAAPITPGEAQAYLYELSLDGGTASIISGVTCTAINGVATCNYLLPTLAKTYTLFASNGFGRSGPATVGGSPPASPGNITITVTVSLTSD